MRALALPESVWVDEFTNALIRCYEQAAAAAGKRRWADKNPENALNAGHWDRTLQGKAFFVMLLRHPFDTIASLCEAKMDKAVPADIRGKAKHVAAYIEAGRNVVAQAPERSITVRYETLVADPTAALQPVLSMINEAFEPAMIENLASPSHGRGLEDPKIRDRGRIDAGSVGRWRRDLDAKDKSIAENELGALVRDLGYA